MSSEWPENDDLLLLVRESHEFERVWRLVRGVSKALIRERRGNERGPGKLYVKPTGQKPSGWDDKMHELEAKTIAQKKQLSTLEECRAFERDTERLLVEALRSAREYANGTAGDPSSGSLTRVRNAVTLALGDYAARMGPRTKES